MNKTPTGDRGWSEGYLPSRTSESCVVRTSGTGVQGTTTRHVSDGLGPRDPPRSTGAGEDPDHPCKPGRRNNVGI